MRKIPISISLAIPTYNNERTVVKELLKCEELLIKLVTDYEILVGEDYGKDKTREILKTQFLNRSKFRIFLNSKNLGIAGNVRNLYKKATKDYVIFFSVDGDWSVKDIERLIMHCYKHTCDVVIGKRENKNYTPYRKLISGAYNTLPKLFFNIKTIDAGSIKIFKRNLITKNYPTSKSVFMEAEIIIRAYKRGGKISSIPVSFNNKTRKTGTGGNIRLVIASFLDLLKLRASL